MKSQAAVLVDAAANLGGAALTMTSPALWTALGLPEDARRPVAGALLTSGLFHLATAATHSPSSSQLRAGAAINAGWVLAGASTQPLPLNGWQRATLLTVVSYDAAMTALKVRAAR